MHPHNTEMDLSIAFALYFTVIKSGGADKTKDIDIKVDVPTKSN